MTTNSVPGTLSAYGLMAVLALGASTALAQPSGRPIEIIVNAPAGGSVDAVARLFAEKVGPPFKGRVVVINKPGAGGVLGEGEVARASGDGSILFTGSSTAVNTVIYKDPPYDPAALKPAALIVTLPWVIVTNQEAPAKNLTEFIRFAKSKRDGIFAGSAAGSTLMALHLLQRAANVEFQIVPYSGGPAVALALIRNDVQLVVADILSMSQQISSGRLRALAITGKERSKLLPDVPTVAEAGLPNYTAGTFFSVFVPQKSSPEFAGTVNAAVNAFVRDPEVKARLEALGGTPGQMSVAEFTKYYEDMRAVFRQVITESKIPLQ